MYGLLHVLLPSVISCLVFRSQNLQRDSSYALRKLSAKILFKIFKKHDLPCAQHRTLNILSMNFQHSKTSPATLVAIIFCFKLFGPDIVEIYLFQHLKRIKDLIGNYKPPEEFIDSPRKHDTTKIGDAIFEALFEYIKSPLMEERTLEYCKQIFGPFGEDVFKRIKSNAL
uniref:TAF6 C-terminal HEAT repeat domain-containing protein n=1 Tax=Panagrolaimus davidi TaxID=227884 RepID=A0A914Q7K0_9BILA